MEIMVITIALITAVFIFGALLFHIIHFEEDEDEQD